MLTDEQVLAAYAEAGSIERAAKLLGVSFGVTQAALHRARENQVIAAAKVKTGVAPRAVAGPGQRARYIVTCAQNDTPLHESFCRNLDAYAAHIGAEILVSRFTYDVGSYSKGQVKPGQEKEHTPEPTWPAWAEEHAADGRLKLAPGLIYCGELNILPTAVRPLSGLDTYTGEASGIIPHVKLAMISTPRLLPSPPRFMYTTGTVSRPNYIQKKAGQKAEFHHVTGALLVEVDETGEWWVRQINAGVGGSFFDLTYAVGDGEVYHPCKWAGLVLGDLHTAERNYAAAAASERMVLAGRPARVVLHDVLDWRSQNHHDRNDPHRRFLKHIRGETSVRAELAELKSVLEYMVRRAPDSQFVVARANHDEALDRWLRETDFRQDPENALVFLRAQLAVYESIAATSEIPDALALCLGPMLAKKARERVRFLRRKERFEIAGIDVSQHGDIGPNGTRASPRSLERLASKAVLGHTHSAGIHDGLYWVGTLRELDADYSKGATSWSHTNCIIYPNGKRALVTIAPSGRYHIDDRKD